MRFVLTLFALLSTASAAISKEWRLEDQSDKITGEKLSFAYISADSWDRDYGFRSKDAPRFFLMCSKKGLKAYVSWESLISCGQISVQYRTPTGKVVSSQWTGSTDCRANFIPNAKLFMKNLGQGGALPLRYTPRTGKITEMEWQFPDPKAVREAMPTQCKW